MTVIVILFMADIQLTSSATIEHVQTVLFLEARQFYPRRPICQYAAGPNTIRNWSGFDASILALRSNSSASQARGSLILCAAVGLLVWKQT